MISVVALAKAENSEEAIRNTVFKAIDLIDFKPKNPVNTVAIKPNLCYYWDSSTGQTTDPDVVASVIDYVRERINPDAKIKVVEADATAMRTKHAFKILGYEEMASEKGVELFNLMNDETINETVTVDGQKLDFRLPLSLLKADLFVNVPKMKIARATKISCAMKNIFGCIAKARKAEYHPLLEQAIVGINKVLHPQLTVVDGVVALGRSPIKLNLIMTGTDPVAVDSIASEIMGYGGSQIGFLKLAKSERSGGIPKVTVRGESPDHFKRIFPYRNHFLFTTGWDIQLRLLRLYSKLTGDILPPVLEK